MALGCAVADGAAGLDHARRQVYLRISLAVARGRLIPKANESLSISILVYASLA